MPAMLEEIVAATHADEDFEGLFEHEWEPENRYLTALRDMKGFTPRPMLPGHPLGRPMSGSLYYSPILGVPNESLVDSVVLIALPPKAKAALDEVPKVQPGEVVAPIESVQLQIFKCIAARPHESILLVTKLGIVTLIFTLLVYFVGGVLIVNPVVAVFGIFGCVLFWTMAKVDERLYHRP